MKNYFLFTLLLSTFLLLGVGCQNQQDITPTSPIPINLEPQAVPEKQKESVSESEPAKPKPYVNDDALIPTDNDFRITNIGDADKIGGSATSVFPIYAYMCDIYEIKNNVPLYYSKIDFFISKNEKNAPTIFLGTTPGGSAGSNECDLNENESSLKSELEPGEYRIWAVRYIGNNPDKRTPDVFISIK